MSQSRRVPCLDGWRGLAVLSVLAGHFSSAGWLGPFGVELFFVLSGRLMANILVEQRQDVRTFVHRRMIRILPALFAFIAIMVVVGASISQPLDDLARSAAAAALFFSNYLVGGEILTLFQHTWSLAVEEHSYIALAALVVLTGREPRKCGRLVLCLAASMMIVTAIRALWGDEGWQFYLRSENRGASILLSFAIATFARQCVDRLPPLVLQWTAPTAFAAALAATNVPDPLFFTLGTLLLAVGVNLIEYSHGIVGRLLRGHILRWFGLVSFSLYLWQQPFYAAHITGLSALIAVSLALLFGAASFYLVESPARRLVRRESAPKPASSLGPHSAIQPVRTFTATRAPLEQVAPATIIAAERF